MWSNIRFRFPAICAITTLALALSILGMSPDGARADGPCTDVEIIGLRGSGEEYLGFEHGMGSLLGPLADRIATELGGSLTASFYGVPYRAADAIKGVLTRDYFDSKDEGSSMLHDHLLERIVDCPQTRFVVMGYSQGAHAAGDLLAREGTFVTDHIAALVMFGDPRFNPEASYDLGSFDLRDHGLAGARSLSDFAGWSSKVLSFCHNDDIVCQGASIWFDHGTGAHDQQRYLDDYGDLAAGLVRKRLGLTSQPLRVPLDLAFVLDSTGSMGSSIDEVREAIGSVVDKLEEKDSDFRLGLVDYKDTDQGDPYAAQLDLDLGTGVDTFRAAIANMYVYGGGDYPEAAYSGLMTAFTDLSWRTDSRKAVLLIGDAPAKDPEPVTGYTADSVLTAAGSLSGIRPPATAPARPPVAISAPNSSAGDHAAIYPIAVGAGPLESFEPLAMGSGGALFSAEDPSQVSEQVVEAVDSAADPVEVVLSSASVVRPGTTVKFTAGASYADGEIVSFEWDFDGDGVTDETTPTGITSHVFPEPYEDVVTVTAITADGHQGSASTQIVVSEDAPVPSGPPTDVSATSKVPNTMAVSWHPPNDLGGSSLLGYQVVAENTATGEVETSVAVGPGNASLELDHFQAGPYLVSITPVTEAGYGLSAQAGATVFDPTSPTGSPAPAATSAAALAAPPTQAKRCRKHFRKKQIHGRARCVRVRHRHRHGPRHHHPRHHR